MLPFETIGINNLPDLNHGYSSVGSTAAGPLCQCCCICDQKTRTELTLAECVKSNLFTLSPGAHQKVQKHMLTQCFEYTLRVPQAHFIYVTYRVLYEWVSVKMFLLYIRLLCSQKPKQ